MQGARKYTYFLWVGLLGGLLIACNSQLPQADVAPVDTVVPVTPTAIPTDVSATESVEKSADGYVNITPLELASMLEEKDFLLINTHAPYGFEIAHTDAHIPLDEGGQWLRDFPDDKTTKVVLYCRSAHWSTIAARALVADGYTNVWHLDGGMVAWNAAGLPLMTQ